MSFRQRTWKRPDSSVIIIYFTTFFLIICSFSQVFQTDFYFITIETYCYNVTFFITVQLCLVFRKILYLHKIFYHYYFLSYFEMTRKKIAWGTYFAIYAFIKFSIPRTPFCLVMFYLLRLLFYCILFLFLSNPSLLCLSNISHQIFFVVVKMNSLVLHLYFWMRSF